MMADDIVNLIWKVLLDVKEKRLISFNAPDEDIKQMVIQITDGPSTESTVNMATPTPSSPLVSHLPTRPLNTPSSVTYRFLEDIPLSKDRRKVSFNFNSKFQFDSEDSDDSDCTPPKPATPPGQDHDGDDSILTHYNMPEPATPPRQDMQEPTTPPGQDNDGEEPMPSYYNIPESVIPPEQNNDGDNQPSLPLKTPSTVTYRILEDIPLSKDRRKLSFNFRRKFQFDSEDSDDSDNTPPKAATPPERSMPEPAMLSEQDIDDSDNTLPKPATPPEQDINDCDNTPLIPTTPPKQNIPELAMPLGQDNDEDNDNTPPKPALSLGQDNDSNDPIPMHYNMPELATPPGQDHSDGDCTSPKPTMPIGHLFQDDDKLTASISPMTISDESNKENNVFNVINVLEQTTPKMESTNTLIDISLLKTPPIKMPRPVIEISDSDDEDDQNLTNMFSNLRIQSERKAKKRANYARSLDDFIVSDSEKVSSDEDNDGHPYNLTNSKCTSPGLCFTPVNQPTVYYRKASFTTPSANKAVNRSRLKMSHELFQLFNTKVFDNQLPTDMEIIWNNRLRTTAGYCKYTGGVNNRTASVELSTKICDTYDRIANTLIHELCHVATWIIDGTRRAGHGPLWKAWGFKARQVFPDLAPISRCHSYEISYKYVYECCRCDFKTGRHSKSVKLGTAVCPYCGSTLKLNC